MESQAGTGTEVCNPGRGAWGRGICESYGWEVSFYIKKMELVVQFNEQHCFSDGIWDGATMTFFPSAVVSQHSTGSFIQELITTHMQQRAQQGMTFGKMMFSIQPTMEHIHP